MSRDPSLMAEAINAGVVKIPAAAVVNNASSSSVPRPAAARTEPKSFPVDAPGLVSDAIAEGQQNSRGNPERRIEPPPQAGIPADPAEWLDLGELPDDLDTYKPRPRQWILKDRILRAAVGFTISPPGVGKTAFQIATGVSVALGHAYLGEEIVESVPVWIYTNEEDREEMLRRLLAFCLAHNIKPSSLRGRLRVSSGYGGKRLIVAKRLPDGTIVQTPETDALIEAIRRTGTGLLLVDPFVSTHAVNENANTEIEEVMAAWRRVAAETNCAIDIAAHIPKSGRDPEAHAGNLDAIRGAGAAGGAARSAFTLARMNEESARLYGVADEERRHLVRLDRAKGNYTAPAGEATWLRMRGVCLDNDPIRPDWVGVFDQVVELTEVEGVRDSKNEERDSKIRVAALALDMRVGEARQLSALYPDLTRLAGCGEETIRKYVPLVLPKVGTPEARNAPVCWEQREPENGGLPRLWLVRNLP